MPRRMRTHSSRVTPNAAECDHATRSNQDRYTALLTWSYASMSDATTSSVTTCGLGKSQSPVHMLTRFLACLLALQGPVTNIVTELDAGPSDRVDQSVSLRLSGAHGRPKAHGTKDTSSVGHDPP